MAHTAKQMIPAVGHEINVHVETWTIPMVVTDVKSAWGRIRLEVEPVTGHGRQWIELSRVQKPNQERAVVAYA